MIFLFAYSTLFLSINACPINITATTSVITSTKKDYCCLWNSREKKMCLLLERLEWLPCCVFQHNMSSRNKSYSLDMMFYVLFQTLFKRVVPHHCLGCIWSQRDKKENKHLAPTIRATIAQFNAVTKCVIRTILNGKELKTHQRAKIIEKWINIAHVKTHFVPSVFLLFIQMLDCVCVLVHYNMHKYQGSPDPYLWVFFTSPNNMDNR